MNLKNVASTDYEEDQHDAMFGKRRSDLLEGRIKKLEKQVEHLTHVVDRTF